VLLLATGIVQSLVEVDAWAELTKTAYGRAVVIKIGLLLVLVGLGALNRQRNVPRLRSLAAAGAAPGSAALVLRRALQAEVAVIAGVIVVTGALSAYPPAKDSYMPMTTVTTTLGNTPMTVTLMPARVGANALDLYLGTAKPSEQHDQVGTTQPTNEMDKITVNATLPAKGIGPIPMEAMKAGPGHYMIESATLGAPGSWTLDVVRRVSDFDQYERRLDVDVR
jgi:copper transport protein